MEQRPAKRRFRLTLSVILIAAVVAAVMVAAWAYPSGRWHGLRYRLTGDPVAFKEAVRRGVRGGQSVDEVISLLGPGIPEDRSAMLRDLAVQAPSVYPDGYREGDRVVTYVFGDAWGVPFQFRDNRLINTDVSFNTTAMLAGPGR